MARINNGVLGRVSGKIGGVVGGSWKGQNYLRTLVIPANPNSEGQQEVRGKMRTIVFYAKQILSPIINYLWDPFQVKMSGFNAFVKANMLSMSSESDWSHFIATQGSLEIAQFEIAGYNAGNGNLHLTWTDAIMSNGESTDKVGAVVIDTQNNVAFSFTNIGTRADLVADVNIGPNRTANLLKGYAFTFRLDGSKPIMVGSSATFGIEE